MSDTTSDPMGQYIIVMGWLYGFPVILANIYAPNWDDHNDPALSPGLWCGWYLAFPQPYI